MVWQGNRVSLPSVVEYSSGQLGAGTAQIEHRPSATADAILRDAVCHVTLLLLRLRMMVVMIMVMMMRV